MTPEKIPEERPGRRRLAVVVEDDADLCAVYAEMMPLLGYRAMIFHNRPAHSMVTFADCPDVFIIDIMLDGSENGIEFAAGLAKQGATCPMIAVSASSVELDHAAASGLFAATMAKPFSIFELSSEIDRLIGLGAEVADAGGAES